MSLVPAKSKHFCILPWTHLHVWPNGNTYMCCVQSLHMPVGVLSETTSLKDIWNGPRVREVRLNMLEDKPSEECHRCYDMETNGYVSKRQRHNHSFRHHVPFVLETGEDGSLPRMNMPYMDIRFSNICNLRCRTCGPDLSSNWVNDAREQGKAVPDRIIRPVNHTNLWDDIEALLPTVEKIYFAGGEPLMMDEHYRILDWLIEHERFDVEIEYNTNFSQKTYRGRSVYEIWNHFNNVTVGASLDGMGEKGEYIRKGMRWANMEANRREMMEVCPKAKMHINYTLSILNFLDMPTFHRTWVEKGLLKISDWNVNPVEGNAWQPNIAPQYIRDKAIESYLEHIDWMSANGASGIIYQWKAAIKILQLPQSDHVLEFERVIKELDTIRGEKFEAVFPELAELMHPSK